MSAPEPVPDEFDPEQNRTIARIKADPRFTHVMEGLGGVPAATPEQIERWDREERESDVASPEYLRRLELEADRKFQRKERARRKGEEKEQRHAKRVDGTAPERAAVHSQAVSTDAYPARFAAQRKPQRTRWIWSGLWPAKSFCIETGVDGVGKSVLVCDLAAKLTRGELPGSFHGKPRPILLLAEEDDFDEVWLPRLIAADANLDLVADLPADERHGPLELVRDIDILRTRIEEHDFAAVFIDQLFEHLPPDVKEGDRTAMRRALAPLRHVLRSKRIGGLATAHYNKRGKDATARERVSGTHALRDLSRADLLVAVHPEDEDRRVVADTKHNLTHERPPKSFAIQEVTFDRNGERWQQPAVRDVRDEPDLDLETILRGPERQRVTRFERLTEKLAAIEAQVPAEGWSPTKLASALGTQPNNGTFAAVMSAAVEAGRWTASGTTRNRLYQPVKEDA
jgi:hypothetical protein